MRIIGVVLAVMLFVLSVPAGLRMRRLRLTGPLPLPRLVWEAGRFILAITAGTALLIAAIWGGR